MDQSSNENTHYADHAMAVTDHEAIYKKVTFRIVPFLFLAFVMCNIDRMNAGFAALDFERDLGFSAAVYGLGASLFFIGYSLFEVPSNLILERIGPRKTFMRIMILWGIASAAQAFVQTPMQFYIVRILLGAAEAGFVPGTIYYLSQWYPPARRAQMQGLFYIGMPIAGVVGSPVSGLIMYSFQDVWTLKGWQWMFIIEGLPAVLLGLYAWKLLDEKPETAKWLSATERDFLSSEVARHRVQKGIHLGRSVLAAALREKLVWAAGAVYFALICTSSAISFWMPSVVKSFGFKDPLQIGLFSAIPPAAMFACMLLLGRHSDRVGERRLHLAIPLLIGSLCLLGLGLFKGNLLLSMILLCGASAMVAGTYPVFWAVPSGRLPASVAAAGLGFVGSMGSLGGLGGSAIFGWARENFGSFSAGLFIIAAVIAVGAIIVLICFGTPQRKGPDASGVPSPTTS
ncbi:MFS transporter [Herbaspirillum seropedicae]|uniref:MFS transporter n=1 Tax=Herbaspirillum seropedicae TaxID=964 RepID=UPI00285F4E34|nr:MFS transporter [Herbaspirillum seropedicae]MDR6397501.1 ACS family phthalate transporter-like MFS transporter [Herbaspirillum seropedicae]